MQAVNVKPLMSDAVAEVLEAMCFMFPDGETTAAEAGYSEREWICGELDFSGSESGKFGIAVPPLAAVAIAANFLGDDESDLTSKQVSEVICELTNMICGSLLAHMNPKNAFTLSPPRPEFSSTVNGAQGERTECTFALDEGFIYTWLEIRDRI